MTYYFLTVGLVYDKNLFDNITNDPFGIHRHLSEKATNRHLKKHKPIVDFIGELATKSEIFFDPLILEEESPENNEKDMRIIFHRETLERRLAEKLARHLMYAFRPENNIKYIIQLSGYHNLRGGCTYQTTTNIRLLGVCKKIIDMYYKTAEDEHEFF